MEAGGLRTFTADAKRQRLFGTVASLVLVGIALTLAFIGSRSGGRGEEAAIAAEIASPSEIGDVANSLGHAIYWAGPERGFQLELSTEAEGNVYLRYLPHGAEAGAAGSSYLTVGSYPLENASRALQGIAKENGTSLKHLEGGGVTLENPRSKGSVYLAYPRSNLEIEVYDPKPGVALRLIRSGKIKPVGG